MTQRILCPIDLSECSHVALAQALVLGKAAGVRVDVLHAYYVPANIQPSLLVWMHTGPRPIRDVAEEQARTELDEFLLRHGADIRERIALHIVHEDATSAILNFATTHETTLILMGTHGRSGASRLFMGSVAERVIRRAPCPVLTVHEPSTSSTAAQAAEEAPKIMTAVKRILVAVDFSDCSRLALRRADELAKALDARLDVLHVWQTPTFVSPEAMVGATPRGQTLPELVKQQSEQAMAAFVKEASDAGIRIESARNVDGDPAQTIVREAEQGEYDLITVGTHGRTGLSHLLLGSVAEKVVRRATRPVLSVREKAPQQL